MRKLPLLCIMVILATLAYAEEIPTPKAVSGVVYSVETGKEVNAGTQFLVNNTANGFIVQGKTGKGPYSGRYSASVNGNDGDLLIVTAWNKRYSASVAILLNGSMHDVNLELRTNVSSSLRLMPIPALKIQAGRNLSYKLVVEGADNQTLFMLNNAPQGMSISDLGLLFWSPANPGSYSANISASDGIAADSQIISVEVTVPHEPQIISAPIVNASVNSPYLYQAMAVDADADNLTYFLAKQPQGMNLSNGLLLWLPGQEGTYDISLGVTDGLFTAWQNFSITVSRYSLTIISLPSLTANVGVGYNYQVLTSKPAQSYSLLTYPEGMSISTSGLVQWTPQQPGSSQVKILAADSEGNAAVQAFIIEVKSSNHAPEITSTPITSARVNQLYTYNVTAYDADDNSLLYSLAEAPANMTINQQNGRISWIPSKSQKGNHTVRIVVVDTKLASDEQDFTIQVNRSTRQFKLRGLLKLIAGSFKITNLDSRDFKFGSAKPGDFMINLIGEEGDLINISLWNSTHSGNALFLLQENATIPEIILAQTAIQQPVMEITVIKNITINFNLAVTAVKLKMRQDQDIDIDVSKAEGKYSGNGVAYQVLEIKPRQPEYLIDEASIEFRVEKSWVKEQGASPDKIVMKRYSSGWNSLETSSLGSDANYYYYSSTSPGFSLFAIVAPSEQRSATIQSTFSISGTIYNPEGAEVRKGTPFSITNENTGEVVKGATGAGLSQGRYSTLIGGKDGDAILISVSSGLARGSIRLKLGENLDNVNLMLKAGSLELITGNVVAVKSNNNSVIAGFLIAVLLIVFIVGRKPATPKGIMQAATRTTPPRPEFVRPEKYFYLKNGIVIRSVPELLSALDAMSIQTYSYHANERKNDFSVWLADAFGLKDIPILLSKATTPSQARDIINAYRKEK